MQVSYNAEGLKGLQKDKASARRDAAAKACESVGGKLESIYYAFGPDDVILIIDMPDNVAAASLATTIAASGLLSVRTTPLLTIAEMDKALGGSANYRPPGR
jgi:uncharacterized protein with GYD domain